MNSSRESAAQSGAVSTDSIAAEPDLATIVKAWQTLPEATRRTILGLVHNRSID